MPRKKTTDRKDKTAPKSKETAPKPQAETLPSTDVIPAPATPGPWKVVKDGLFWLVIWTCFFLCFDGCRQVLKNGLPAIRFECRQNDAKTSLGRWILAERPPLLMADYPAVGRELAETAKRLRAGQLDSQNAACADTIARVQPSVSDQNTWRVFLSRMNGEIQGGNLEKLAEQYDDAAGLFGVKAVEALIEAVPIMEESNEESVDEADSADSDSDCFVVDERLNQDEDQPVSVGSDSGPVSSAEETAGAGEADRAVSRCPGGQCQTTYPQSSPSPFWPGYSYGLPW